MPASTHTALSCAALKSSVLRAISSKLTSPDTFILRLWMRRILARASSFGWGNSTLRSRRPERMRAGSRISARLVAAITLTSSWLLKPSSWFRSSSMVRCTSLSPLSSESKRFVPIASISSMKMMQGAFALAFSNRSRTRDAPTPTNSSTNSEAAQEKKGVPASPATALASRVLPVPGGPTRRQPLGILAPRAVYLSGFFRKSTISTSSSFAPSQPATSSKVTPVSGTSWNLDLDLPNSIGPPMGFMGPPPGWPFCARRNRKKRPPKAIRGNRMLPSSAT
mmetsp:Transcript_27206/g.59434  ORF Transcript_27206/g.59434 Transcript_27206/m.59434 type:complete len:280 (-) Transcript_27206:704-1543(-)